MNVIEITEVPTNTNIVSLGDTAMFINIFHRETVDEILEVFTDYTDYDIIGEVVDTLGLNITAVVEPTNHGPLIHGFIHEVLA